MDGTALNSGSELSGEMKSTNTTAPRPNIGDFVKKCTEEGSGFSPVKLPEWKGFWFNIQGSVMVFTKDGEILDTPDFDQYGSREDWEHVNFRSEDIALLHSFIKALRIKTDTIYLSILSSLPKNRETALAATAVQTGFMWMGLMLGALKAANPYPESMNAASPVIEKATDKSSVGIDNSDQTSLVKTLRLELQRISDLVMVIGKWEVYYDHGGNYPADMAVLKSLTEGKLWLGQQLNNIRVASEQAGDSKTSTN